MRRGLPIRRARRAPSGSPIAARMPRCWSRSTMPRSTTPAGALLFRTGRLWICQGDRIVLLGRNGAGKTRLLDMIRHAIDRARRGDRDGQGDAVAGAGLWRPGAVRSRRRRHAAGSISRRFEIGEQRARGLLAGAGIAIDMQAKPIGSLSGGQKARLGMLVLRLDQSPNFYLLDEPTNHLDIDGQEALEAELLEHEASCLLVSHDRSFVRAVGTRFWLIERGDCRRSRTRRRFSLRPPPRRDRDLRINFTSQQRAAGCRAARTVARCSGRSGCRWE